MDNRFLARGAWDALVRSLSHGVDRDQVLEQIGDGGFISGRYLMMSVLSAGIATLGLLLSSPAVVIGAMLLSPLMGPIILLGFSFWTVDWIATRRAIISLSTGLGVALAVAVVLTVASPLKEPTAEILARTHPNLFDLLVAAFSGIAGGYAVIRQRGETVIGVAIATALMPPIATVGFGLGTGNWTITVGALLLFATNLIAIALAAAAMAALYGFRPHYHLANRGWIGHASVILIVGALCVPLTLSLNTIALESHANVSVRSDIADMFGPSARITALSVRQAKTGLQIDALVATPKYVDSAAAEIARRVKAGLGAAATVNLDQVVIADPAKLVAQAAPIDPTASAVRALRDGVPFPTDAVAFDPATNRGVVLLGTGSGLDLKAAMTLEAGLRQRSQLAGTQVVPPLQPLAAVGITLAKDQPPVFSTDLATDLWALQRWRVQRVAGTLCGLGSRDRRRRAVEAAAGEALKVFDAKVAWGGRSACAGGQGTSLAIQPR